MGAISPKAFFTFYLNFNKQLSDSSFTALFVSIQTFIFFILNFSWTTSSLTKASYGLPSLSVFTVYKEGCCFTSVSL
jgi:hypothetical protein